MAQQFLDRLPRVEDGKLPASAECMICREKYGTFPSDNGIVEHAVLLPCCHHVGSECIAIWLSPETGLGDSCPLCRTVLFYPEAEDYDDEDEDDEDHEESDEEGSQNEGSDENDEEQEEEKEDSDEDGEGGDGPGEAGISMSGSEQAPMIVQWAFQRPAACCYVITPPCEDGEGGWDGQEWFERWPISTRQQYPDSEKHALRTLLKPQSSGLLHGPSRIYSLPADLESKAEELASAYRTMVFRKTLWYLILKEAKARIRPLESPHKGPAAHHEAMLPGELSQRGAFSNTQVRPGHMTMKNHHSWYVH